jgi:hypothetical protein
VYELPGESIRTDTPWLIWRAGLSRPGSNTLSLGHFLTADDAARAYDAEVRRRGWVHLKPLNFPQLEELAAYVQTQAKELCDERGLPLSLAPEPRAAIQGAAAAHGASGQRPPKLSAQKPGKSGFFGVAKQVTNDKTTPWRAVVHVHGANTMYTVGYFATTEEAARAYDAEIRRRGWTHVKRLNFPDPAGDGALPPSSAVAAAGPSGVRGAE